MISSDALRAELQRIADSNGDQWYAGLEPRKQKESEFHDKKRDASWIKPAFDDLGIYRVLAAGDKEIELFVRERPVDVRGEERGSVRRSVNVISSAGGR